MKIVMFHREPMFCELMRTKLEQHGIEMLATSMLDYLETLVEGQKPALILMDILTLDLEGSSEGDPLLVHGPGTITIQRLRKSHPQIPIIVLCELTALPLVTIAKRAGVVEFVGTNTSIEKLVGVLRAAVAGTSS